MLITDGKQTPGYNGPSPADVAKAMRNRGIEIQVIGIGPAIDKTELLQLVSHPRLLRTPKNFGDSLSSILDEQVRSLCSGKEGLKNNICRENILVFFVIYSYSLKIGIREGQCIQSGMQRKETF